MAAIPNVKEIDRAAESAEQQYEEIFGEPPDAEVVRAVKQTEDYLIHLGYIAESDRAPFRDTYNNSASE